MVLATSAPAVQRAVDIVAAVGGVLGLAINPSKSGILVMGPTVTDPLWRRRAFNTRNDLQKAMATVAVGGTPIPAVQTYEYLGITVSQTPRYQAHMAEDAAHATLGKAVHASTALAKATWIPLEVRRRTVALSVVGTPAYHQVVTGRASLVPLRRLDTPTATHIVWAQLGLHTRLLHFPYPAALHAIGIPPLHLHQLHARVTLLLRLVRGRRDTPAFIVLMLSILDCQGHLPAMQADPMAWLLQADCDACSRKQVDWCRPWAARPMGELCMLGYPEAPQALTALAQAWLASLDAADDSQECHLHAMEAALAALPTLDSDTGRLATACTPPLHTCRMDTLPSFPHRLGLLQRIKQLEAVLTVAATVPTEAYHPAMALPQDRRPKSYHVDVRAHSAALLHPIPRGLSPAIWACGRNTLAARKVLMLQTQQVLHGLQEATTFTACPLCQDAAAGVAGGGGDIMRHVVLHCPVTAPQRAATLQALTQLVQQGTLHHPGHHHPDPNPDPHARATAPTTVPIPHGILAALHWAQQAVAAAGGGDDRQVHEEHLWRLLLCGQWPTGGAHMALTPQEAAAYTFPHHPALHIPLAHVLPVDHPAPAAEEEEDGDGGSQPHLPAPRGPPRGTLWVCPTAQWRAVLRRCVAYCGHVFDGVLRGMLAGTGVAAQDRAAAMEAARHMHAAVHGQQA